MNKLYQGKPTTLDFIKSVLEKSTLFDFENKLIEDSYRPWEILRFLSSEIDLVPLLTPVNRFTVPKKSHYLYLYYTIPKGRRFINMTKGKVVEKEERSHICDFFEFGTNDFKAALEILSHEDIQLILNLYKVGKQ